MKRTGQLIVLSGPSGVGKSTLIAEVLSQRRDIHFSVSYTTRPKRTGEENGVHYNFVPREEFERMMQSDELLECAEYVGNLYGTSLKTIREVMGRGVDVLLDIDVRGAQTVREKCPDAVFIFIVPPSFEELSRRLRARNLDHEDVVAERLLRAKEECKLIPLYDYLVVNDQISDAAKEITAILRGERCRVKRRLHESDVAFLNL